MKNIIFMWNISPSHSDRDRPEKNSINMKRIIKIGRQAFADFIRLRGRI
ncbi:hypothetical protein CK1_36160 [Ruminococcus sp. SR1/5]|nr:hypothetical protein CK1_36160 [Ruminococcus sp. SR1/5]